jgi:uncharacterized membrane protein YeaQ/YmgE (transglycosylase-associated protein family)
MTLGELIVYLIIAGICGAIAKAIAGGTRGGLVVSILLGFLGTFVGTWLARVLHLPQLLVVSIGDRPFPIFWSIVGGIVLVVLAHVLVRPRYVGRFQP